MSGNHKIVVVGAGIAGLGAAYALGKRGLEAAVFEASAHPEGRTVAEEVDGFHINLGATIFLESYGAVRQVAEELGVSLKRTPVPLNGGLYHNGKFHGFYSGNLLKKSVETAMTFLSFQLLSPKGIRQALKFVRMLKARAEDLSLDDHSRMLDLDTGESVAAFFESNIGTEFLERFATPPQHRVAEIVR